MKFKMGDHIVVKEGTSQYDRVVVGYSQNGYVVYEYKSASGGQWSLTSDHEDQYKLAPVKKEGWINIYAATRYEEMRAGAIYPSEATAKLVGSSSALATIKIEWEE